MEIADGRPIGNYDVNDLWYEYEGKKKSDREAVTGPRDLGEVMAIEA